jgi:hypothetical protein
MVWSGTRSKPNSLQSMVVCDNKSLISSYNVVSSRLPIVRRHAHTSTPSHGVTRCTLTCRSNGPLFLHLAIAEARARNRGLRRRCVRMVGGAFPD